MLNNRFAIVDLETTGGSFSYDRIIEVAVILLEDGNVLNTFQTLLNPERYVPESILELTGIHKEELLGAPTFKDIMPALRELLDDAIFVAHNARFDKGFLKAEFARHKIGFNPKTLCTVQLSRKVFPGERYHNLDELILRLNAECHQRHRALDDAKVLHVFFQYIEEQYEEQQRRALIHELLKEVYLPPRLSKETLNQLSNDPGVYIFYDEHGFPLYVGKSIHIRERVLSHFQMSATSTKEMRIFQNVADIETVNTCGELGALLLESTLIKKLQPLYNRKLRQRRLLTAIQKNNHNDSYHGAGIITVSELDSNSVDSILGVFKSKGQAEDYLEEIAKEFLLCKKLLGLEKTKKACFGYQLKRCNGVCIGLEDPCEYNSRFEEAFKKTALRKWPFEGIIALEEKNEAEGKGEVFFMDEWCLVATGKYAENDFILENIPEKVFDYDQYKILNRYLSKRIHKSKKFRVLSHQEFQRLVEAN